MTNPLKIRKYFAKHTGTHGAGIDFTEDQRRLQDEFHDKRLLLRYNYLLGIAQVWYDAPSGLYIVFGIEPPYNLQRAIYYLRQRQKKRKELLAQYNEQKQASEATFDYKNKELARETAEVIRKHKVGKVTTSARTKRKSK